MPYRRHLGKMQLLVHLRRFPNDKRANRRIATSDVNMV